MGKRGTAKQGRVPTGRLPTDTTSATMEVPRSWKSRPNSCAASSTCTWDPFPHHGDPGAVPTASLLQGDAEALGRVLRAHLGEHLVVPVLRGQIVGSEVFGLGHEAGVCQRLNDKRITVTPS